MDAGTAHLDRFRRPPPSAAGSENAVLGRDPLVDCLLSIVACPDATPASPGSRPGICWRTWAARTDPNQRESSVEPRADSHRRYDSIGVVSLEFDAELTTSAADDDDITLPTEPLERNAVSGLASRIVSEVSSIPETLPRVFGKFDLIEKLGQGGMGAFTARAIKNRVASSRWKLIKNQSGRREAFLEFFHNREAVLAREIDHPNVVRVYEHGVVDDQHFISMEYVRGENLYRVLKRRELSPEHILEILRQIACGLAAAHEQGVVHSDIKPANVVVSEDFLSMRESSESVEDDDSAGILEFIDTGAGSVRDADDGLEDEIRRRVGERPDPIQILEDPPYFDRGSEMRFLEHYVDRMEEERGFSCSSRASGESGRRA